MLLTGSQRRIIGQGAGSSRAFAIALVCMELIVVIALSAHGALGAEYYVSNAGSDDADGRSPQTAWRTLAYVSAQSFEPGDIIRLRRGDVWREGLRPCSGTEDGPVTYSAYGDGPKPLLLGSLRMNRPDDWVDEGNNIWATREPNVTATGTELIRNSDFSTGVGHWSLYAENGAKARVARDTEQFVSAPSACRIDCEAPGKNSSDIQFYISSLPIEEGKIYRLSFRAKATVPLDLHTARLMATGPPWAGYSRELPSRRRVTGEWQEFHDYYTAVRTAQDGRLTFFLGGLLPEGAGLFIDDVSFREAQGEVLGADVGNIILNREELCGVKVWNEEDLDTQGEYWYDEESRRLKMYSVGCPATVYTDIECALRLHMINQSGGHHIVYENLALKYGGAHGIGGGSTHHITVRDCDFGFIGGGDQMGGDRTVRFGNGIEFWGAAHDNLVERCRLWEIYDAALTNQSGGPQTDETITYRNNLIWNCEYSFEYWNRPEASLTENIRFEHNTCINAGHGWGHTQRPDPSGRHLCFYTSPARAKGISIRNNIFYEARTNAFYAPTWTDEQVEALELDHNCWFQAQGVMMSLKDTPYTMDQFAEYQTQRGQEPHDAEGLDLRLRADSPCIDAGGDVGVTTDFAGARRPQGDAPDIGAYEHTGE